MDALTRVKAILDKHFPERDLQPQQLPELGIKPLAATGFSMIGKYRGFKFYAYHSFYEKQWYVERA